MIDLSALGLPSVQTSHHGGKRQKSGAAHDTGKDAGNFGDLIGDAGKKNVKKQNIADQQDQATHAVKHGSKKNADTHGTAKGAGHEAAADADQQNLLDDFDDADLADIDAADAIDMTEADVLDLAEADVLDLAKENGESEEAQSRVRLSKGFQQLMKANAEGGVLNKADQSNVEAKTGKIQDKKDPDAAKQDHSAVKEKSKASASEELHALLGMKADDGDQDGQQIDNAAAKPDAKRSAHDADDKTVEPKEAKPQHAAVAATTAAEMVHQAASVHDAAAAAVVEAPVSRDVDDKKPSSDNDVSNVQIVSTSGKNRTADVDVPKAAESSKSSASSANDVDFVSVIDSRRYLGFSGDSNAAALTNAIKADPSWAQAIHEANTAANLTATEVNTLKLQMNPEHLGNMTASLRLKGEELSVEVRVETVEAYRQLSNDQDSIVKALKDQGFAIDQISIQLSPSARSDAGQGSGQNQSGNAGQNLQQGGQGDNARQRDESTRRNANQNNWTGNDQTSSFNNSGSNSDTSRAGNIYL